MKLFKFKKTNSNLKIVLVLLLSFVSLSSAFSQENTTKQKEENGKQATPVNNRTTTQEGRVPATLPTDTRDIELTPEDQIAIEAEEKGRLKMEAELAKDEAKLEIRNRTFGSNIFSNNKFSLTQSSNIPTPNNYILGPGDKLAVVIYGYSQASQTVTVNPDGYVLLEKSGLVNIAGLNIEDAETKIKAALSKTYLGIKGAYGYSPNTFVKVSLTGLKTIKIRITGEVVAPGTYTVTTFSSLMTALYVCGGPNDIGTYRNVKLIRGNRVIVQLDLYKYIVDGFSEADLLLKDQDIINVGPFESRIAITGNTKRIGLFELKPNETLSDLIKYAGGFNQYAYSDIVKVYRNTASERKIVNVDKGDFSKETMFTGDSLVVERVLERFENMIVIEGAVFRPGEYSLDSNPTLSQLIKSASGLKEESLQGRINVIRTNPDLSVSNISVNLFDIHDGRISDIVLKRLDKVFVPSIFELTEEAFIRIRGAINNVEAVEGVKLPYVKNMTIQDVLVRVGGITEAASLSRIEIVRRKRNMDPEQKDAQIAEVKYYNISADLSLVGSTESNILLPFDEIIVRTSPNYEKQSFVKITGEVLYPGTYAIQYKDEAISDLISRAGGLTPLAYVEGATLSRKTLLTERQRIKREETLSNLKINKNIKTAEILGEEDIMLKDDAKIEGADFILNEDIGIELDKILKDPNNKTFDLILYDGDEIAIPKKLETVRIEGEVLYPTSVKYQENKSFLSYISSSGGFTKNSMKGSAYVRYPNGDVDRTRKFMFVRIHPKVQPGSEIIVPTKTTTAAEQFGQLSGLIATLSATMATVVTIIGLIKLSK